MIFHKQSQETNSRFSKTISNIKDGHLIFMINRIAIDYQVGNKQQNRKTNIGYGKGITAEKNLGNQYT